MPYQIFLNYRKSDTSAETGRLFDRLTQEFGEGTVFQDKESIESGSKWPANIAQALQESKVIIVVIGPHWYKSQDEVGKRRLDQKGDWVRKEIETAFEQDKIIIPLTVKGAEFYSDKKYYPTSLQQLTRLQKYKLNDNWNLEILPLINRLAALIPRFHPFFDIIPIADIRPQHLLKTRAEEKNGFQDYYYERPYLDDKLIENFEYQQHTIIVGKSLSGKSRSLLQLTQKLQTRNIDILIPKSVALQKEHFSVPKVENGLVLINDLDRYLGEDNAGWVLEQLIESGQFKIMATCWPENLQAVREKLVTTIENFEPITINPLTLKEKSLLTARFQKKRILLPDDTVGSFCLPFEKAKTDFQRFSDDSLEHEIMRACKMLFCWYNTLHYGFATTEVKSIVAHRMKEHHGHSAPVAPGKWGAAVKHLNSLGLLQIREERLQVEEVYLYHFFPETADTYIIEYAHLQGDELAFSKAVKRCWKETSRRRLIREYETKTGKGSVILYTALLSRVEDFEQGLQVLQLMQEASIEPDVVTFNTLLNRTEDFQQGRQVVLQLMQKSGIAPDVVTFTTLLNRTKDFQQGRQVLLLMQETGIAPNVITFNTLLNRTKDFQQGRQVLQLIQEAGIAPNVVTFTTLLNRAEDFEQGLQVLLLMQETGIAPNVVTFNTLLNRTKDFQQGRQVLQLMQEAGITPDVVTYTTLLNRTKDFQQGHQVLQLIQEAGIAPDVITFNTLLTQVEDFEQGLQVLLLMQETGIAPNVVTFNTLLNQSGNFEQGLYVLQHMQEAGITPDVVTFTTLLNQAEDFQHGREVLQVMEDAGIAPDVITFNTLLTQVEDFEQGLQVLELMQEAGIVPDVVAFTTLLNQTKDFQQGSQVFLLMQEIGTDPDLEFFNALLNLVENFEQGLGVLSQLQAAGFVPDTVTFSSLLGCTAGIEQGLSVLQLMREANAVAEDAIFDTLLKKTYDFEDGKELFVQFAQVWPIQTREYIIENNPLLSVSTLNYVWVKAILDESNDEEFFQNYKDILLSKPDNIIRFFADNLQSPALQSVLKAAIERLPSTESL